MAAFVITSPLVARGISRTRTVCCGQQKDERSVSSARLNIARRLSEDLPNQFRTPRKMDWSIYDPAITFDDPLTQLSGILLYKGMILTIALIVKLFFENSYAKFELSSCELTSDGEKVQTIFKTTGRTRWGTDVVISGIDYFWLTEVAGAIRIIRHQSTWDQTVDKLREAFGVGK